MDEINFSGNITYEPLVRLLHLEDGWDGHGAPAPSRAAIDVARAVLQEATQRPDLDKAWVTADVEGGVAIYFFGGPRLPDGGLGRQAGVLVDNDGDGVLYMRDRSRPGSVVDDVRSDTDALRDVLGRIATFLSGM